MSRNSAWTGRKGSAWLKHIKVNDPCAYCNGPSGTIEHVTPFNNPEQITTGLGRNHWTNLVAACYQCNHRRWSKPLLSYLIERSKETHIHGG